MAELTRGQIAELMTRWNQAWEVFDLEGVLAPMADDVLFENWTGGQVRDKQALRAAWGPWFGQGGFRFVYEDLFIDDVAQKVLYQWRLEGPCLEPGRQQSVEARRGVDVISLVDGQIKLKLTYCKTSLLIDGKPTRLKA